MAKCAPTCELGSSLHFVRLQGPGGLATSQQDAGASRSHAIRAGLEKKRRLERETGRNFRVAKSHSAQDRCASAPKTAIKRSNSPSAALTGPRLGSDVAVRELGLLAEDAFGISDRLRSHRGDRRASTFTVADDLVLNNLGTLMRTSLDDAALRSAVMLTASFAAAGRLDRESLEHQSHTLRVLSARVQSADMAASEPTLAAMLLLAGIEARLSMADGVQLHMNAVKHLIFGQGGTRMFLTLEMKRAIFWQDLNASTMTGSTRIVDHDTFEELRWSRGATGFPSIFVLPEGFQEISHLLSDDLIEALKDIHAFQRIRDSDLFPTATVVSPMQIDNHQASIQSRLSGRPDYRTRESPLQECCRIAAYLCCAMLRCPMWRTSGAPAYLASQLLQCLQSCRSEPIWFHNPEIFAWLLYIGGAFSPSDSELRSEFVNDLCRSVVAPGAITRRSTSFCSWPETVRFVKRYIWSDKAYTSYIEHFWHDIKSFGKSSSIGTELNSPTCPNSSLLKM